MHNGGLFYENKLIRGLVKLQIDVLNIKFNFTIVYFVTYKFENIQVVIMDSIFSRLQFV
jgi:hypothetical protein